MVPRKLIFHIGPHKTGTSAVQRVLRTGGQRELLYPQVGLWETDGAHHGLVFNFYRDFSRPDVPRLDVSAMLSELGRQVAASDAGVVLLSSEELEGRDLQPFHDAVLAALPPADWHTEVLFTYRDHVARASSLYNQWVKDGAVALTLTPDEFLRAEKNSLCYRPALEELKAAGLRVNLVQYEPSATFVPRFLAFLGIETPPDRDSEVVNVSLSPVGLVAMLGLNTLAPNLEARDAAFRHLQSNPWMWARSTDVFGLEIRRQIAPLFAEDRAYLEREFGVVLPAAGSTPDQTAATDGIVLGPEEFTRLAEASRGIGPLCGPLLEFAQRFRAPTPTGWKAILRALADFIRPR